MLDGLVFIGLGIVAFVDGLRRLTKTEQLIAEWPLVKARVISCYSSPLFSVRIGRFRINQRTFAQVAHQVAGEWYESKCEVEVGAQHKRGDSIEIRYDPKKPVTTVLNKGLKFTAYAEIFGAALTLLYGVGRVAYLLALD